VSSLCGRVFPNYAGIVSSNDGLHIVHATIADLNCVSVKHFVKFVVRWKMFVIQALENCVQCWFDTLTERRVKANDAALPISAWLLWCFFHVHGKKRRARCSTGLNNVLLPTLFALVNNIEQYC
jgi:hypothetical protein